MFIWSALVTDDELEEVRDRAIGISEETGVKCPLTIIPLHISLKISFEIDDSKSDECIDVLCDYLSGVGPFYVETEGYERKNGIVWIKIKKNPRLEEIHVHLDSLMKERFGIEPHELDRSFIFHSTVFLDDDEKLDVAYAKLCDIPLPKRIMVRDYLIGTSPTIAPGSYSVLKHSHLGHAVSVQEEWNEMVEKK